MTYDSTEYWIKRGKGYQAEFARKNPIEKIRYCSQERQVKAYLKKLNDIRTVLEVGAGFGRMTRVLSDAFPNANISTIDISSKMLSQAIHNLKDKNNIQFYTMSLFDLDDPCPKQFDLVFASEVLLHIPPKDIERATWILSCRARKHFIHIDWYAPGELKESGDYCWQHGYGLEKIIPIKDIPIISMFKSGKARAAIFHEEF